MSLSTLPVLFLLVATQPAEAADPPWSGQMQCAVTWTDPADAERSWMFAVASDTSNMKLAISDRARAGDPKPLEKDESRELKPRKARLAVTGIGDGEVEVTSYPIGEDRMWHDVALGHVENLDKFPAQFTLALTVEKAAPMKMEMRDFDGARAYLKRCLDR
ncbi:hypothetical protein [Sphingopyxis sp.]|uniref:hypothetical protein n=1 Tax=Sphingopyxis sp. TaxID=1908224 RepID=UPI002D77167F|nr:hypothetical protein [Sphingopyxis sp.]HET6524700.1 hypothetical protein [Sphingopyxis sp.]